MPFQSTVGDYKTVATLETFGFLPPMTQDEIYDQIAYIIAQGWSPLIEHVHPSNSMATYWSYWKLPFFGEKDLNVVVSELEACVKARNAGRHLEKESRDILTEAAKHSPELAIALETWKEIKFEFDTVDKLDVQN